MIYESPDQGKTVYARQPGSAYRTLIQGEDQQHLVWQAILVSAKQDPVLQRMLDRAESYFRLKHLP